MVSAFPIDQRFDTLGIWRNSSESGQMLKLLYRPSASWKWPRVIQWCRTGGPRPTPSIWRPFRQFNPALATKWWLLPTPT